MKEEILDTEMYIRTVGGLIGKIIEKYKGVQNRIIYKIDVPNDDFDYTNVFKFEVKKTSHNIIDLVEIGDLCVIEFYSHRYEKRIERLFEIEYKKDHDISFQNAHCNLNIFGGEWSNADKQLKPIIKSIVTKEQFEQVKYKVGE